MVVRYHVVNLLRTMKIPRHVAIKRVPRPGRWKEVGNSGGRDPWPTLVEFANPRHTDGFLAAEDRIKTITMGEITMQPDDSAISTIRSKDTKEGSTGFNTKWLQAPKLRIHKLGGGNEPKATLCSGAGGEPSESAQIGRPNLEQTPVTEIHRRNQKRMLMRRQEYGS